MAYLSRPCLFSLLLLPAVVASFSLAPSSRTAVVTRAADWRPSSFVAITAIASSSNDAQEQFEDAQEQFEETEDSLQKNVRNGLKKIDSNVLLRAIRIGNHLPTLISLVYFGLMSMVSNMPSGSSLNLSPTAKALTRRIGPVTSAEFSAAFSTAITPVSFVFFAWPLISVVQLLTVGISALRPGRSLLSHADLTCISMANVLAAAWLLVTSQPVQATSPLSQVLILPFIPLIIGFPLRNLRMTPIKTNWRNAIYQLYSSFTTIASFLALTVELQYGGRIPLFGGRGELCSAVFLSLYAFLVRFPGQGIIKRYVNAIAMGGIVLKKLMGGLTLKSVLSVSFLGSCGVLYLAVNKLFQEVDENAWNSDTTVESIKGKMEDILESFSPPEDDL
eukprot:CAMPEP_0202486700 /NCGR_PEP_ID=MMETSP1361-20130828/5192_1 /ASSEMBLY_ACC=CAM_ASM_000849 /TAXON_ID=210615 /ORGANISM="Staurosira complex sp., Strain CCMP2646" /LENGTH=389 /DNA_ID=CAMNT_0049115903 /DNA_START=18 /DNA_END=1187 /DNA_ORIENTATION=-